MVLRVNQQPGPSPLAGGAVGPAMEFGEWKSARITDTSRPLGRPFRAGDRVYYRAGGIVRGIAVVHLFATGPDSMTGGKGVRRNISQRQLRGHTNDWATDVPAAQQRRLSDQWNALALKHGGYHDGTRIPKFVHGMITAITDDNPELAPGMQGWQGDTVPVEHAPPDIRIIVEGRVFKNPPVRQAPEQDEQDCLDVVLHERVEFDFKGDLVNDEAPFCALNDWMRGLDEWEGIAHVLTIGEVEQYYGIDAEARYNAGPTEYGMMRRRGFGKLVDQWEKTDL